METTNLVNVKYEDKYHPKTFGGMSYTYMTAIPLKVGDLVIAPTSFRNKIVDKIARVSEINIPYSKVMFMESKLKLITEKIDKQKYLQKEAA